MSREENSIVEAGGGNLYESLIGMGHAWRWGSSGQAFIGQVKRAAETVYQE